MNTMDRSNYPSMANGISMWKRDYTPGPLTQEEFCQFFDDGFVMKDDLLKRDQLESVIKSIENVVDELARDLYKAVRFHLCL